jgi:ABC-type antimicrobial peptide transport system permease subunit
MKIRKITSLTAGLAFLVMLLTSVILYIVPAGRIAYWADWHFVGSYKNPMG